MLLGRYFPSYQRRQHFCPGVPNNLRVDLATTVQYAKYRNLPSSTATTLALTDTAKVAFI